MRLRRALHKLPVIARAYFDACSGAQRESRILFSPIL